MTVPIYWDLPDCSKASSSNSVLCLPKVETRIDGVSFVMPAVKTSLAVVCALAQGSHQGDSSLAYCLPLESVGSDEGLRVAGEPFRLHNRSGRYIWGNEQLRNEGITCGAVVIYQNSFFYSGNTEKKMVSGLIYLA